MLKKITLPLALTLLTALKTFGQGSPDGMPRIIGNDGRHALLVDGKPFFILGGQAHNSSAWPGMLPPLWQAAAQLHANTVEVPLYWEQVEPQAGRFDFSMIDTLLAQARQHQLHLVLLWFGTWKNGSNHYMPEWMKREARRYPNITGKNGQPVDSPSPHSRATLEADLKAFTAVMGYLKQADALHTVIMVQVENETGSWGSVRDYSAEAQKLFKEAVPAALLQPAVLKALNVSVGATGTWQQVFGDRADEYFQAWSIARFVGRVAAAGKAVYPLPLYVNAALRDPLTNPTANNYESGGPTDNVIPIWKVAAPAIDLLAPDIYLSGSERVLKVIDLYDRPDNTLFVPEAGLIADNAKYLFPVIAHGGIGFAPFGIDANGVPDTLAETGARLVPFAQEYAVVAPMSRELAQWAFEGKIKAVAEHEDHVEQKIDLGAWQMVVTFGRGQYDTQPADSHPNGKLLVVQLAESKFVVIGTGCHITFIPTGNNANRAWQYLRVEEGRYQNGVWLPLRILNGDETDFGGPVFGAQAKVLQVELVLR
jgi:beta-galactosidase GanA